MHEVVRLDVSLPPPGRARYGMTLLVLGIEGQGLQTLAEAWAHHKARHDPPGMTEVFGCGGLRDGEVVRGWKFRFGISSDEKMHTSSEAARAAAWVWYERRHALAKRLDNGIFCPRCQSQDAYTEDIDATTTTQPWCTECDVEMGGLFDDVWPRLLTWTDEQVAEVERWLADSSAAMPEVLRG